MSGVICYSVRAKTIDGSRVYDGWLYGTHVLLDEGPPPEKCPHCGVRLTPLAAALKNEQ